MFVYLKTRDRENLPSTDSLSRWPQYSELVQAEARSQALHPSLLYGDRSPNIGPLAGSGSGEKQLEYYLVAAVGVGVLAGYATTTP